MMTNKNYRKGYNYERKVVLQFREEGSPFAQRMAGSHSPADVIGVKGDKIYFIQCKNTKQKQTKEKEKFKKWSETMPKILHTQFVFLDKKTNKEFK